MTNNLARAEEEKVLPERVQSIATRRCIVPSEPLSDEVKRRLTMLQRLDTCKGKADYGTEQTRVAQELGMSLRSLFRLQRQYQELGIASITRQGRSDEGQFRVSDFWQTYILKAYRDGNKGQRQTSRAQVAKQVEKLCIRIRESEIPQPQ